LPVLPCREIAGFEPSTEAVLPVDSEYVPWPHNLYLEIAAERGVVTLIVFLFLTARVALVAWRLSRSGYPNARLIGSAVMGSVATFGFASAIELTFLHLWVVVVWLVLVALTCPLQGLYESHFHIGAQDA
jgi:O-antigen ligase